MAASMGMSRNLQRAGIFLQRYLKISRNSVFMQHKAHLHISVSREGRVLRRRPLQVILQDGVDPDKARPSNSMVRPNVRPNKPRLGSQDSESGEGLYNSTADNRVKIEGDRPSDTYFARRDVCHTKHSRKLQDYPACDDVEWTEQNQVKYNKATSVDKRFGKVMALAKNRKMRDKSNKVVLEGYRLIRDALLAGARAHTIFFTLLSNIEGLPINKKETELVMVPYKEFLLWSDLATPQGIVGVFSKPTNEIVAKDGSEPSIPLTLVCDNIRDPGNLGTILRAAAAANCQKIIVTKGCVDIWDPKVLRAGAGAHFHIPVIGRATWSEVSNYIGPNTALYIADTFKELNTGEIDKLLSQVPHSELDWTVQSALVIGGETEGISQEAVDLCQNSDGTVVYIPMSQGVDSLNAAMSATVMLFEAKRQWGVRQKTKR